MNYLQRHLAAVLPRQQCDASLTLYLHGNMSKVGLAIPRWYSEEGLQGDYLQASVFSINGTSEAPMVMTFPIPPTDRSRPLIRVEPMAGRRI